MGGLKLLQEYAMACIESHLGDAPDSISHIDDAQEKETLTVSFGCLFSSDILC